METNIASKLAAMANQKPPNKILAISTDSKSAVQVSEGILNYFVNDLKLKGIYIAFTTPTKQMFAKMKNGKQILDNIKVIDAIGTKKTAISGENAQCMQGPTALTEISICITKCTNTGKCGFVYVDSMTSLTRYNGSELAERFMRYLINKLRSMDIPRQILFVYDEKTNPMVNIALPLVDEHIIMK